MCYYYYFITFINGIDTHTHTHSIHAYIPSCMLCSSACTSMTFVIFIHVQTSSHARTHTHACIRSWEWLTGKEMSSSNVKSHSEQCSVVFAWQRWHECMYLLFTELFVSDLWLLWSLFGATLLHARLKYFIKLPLTSFYHKLYQIHFLLMQ